MLAANTAWREQTSSIASPPPPEQNARARTRSTSLTLHVPRVTAYDMSTAEEVHASTSLGECCELCAQTTYGSGTPCAFFHADASNSTCVLHNDNAPDFQIPSDTATSGFVGYTPTPPTPTVTAVDVVIDDVAGVVSTTQPNLGTPCNHTPAVTRSHAHTLTATRSHRC